MSFLTDLLGIDNQEWMSDPARPCAKRNPDDWFPHDKYLNKAKSLCDGCPQKVRCLQYALEERLEDGIFGGLTPAERQRIAKGDAA